jgi:hypothetical protein
MANQIHQLIHKKGRRKKYIEKVVEIKKVLNAINDFSRYEKFNRSISREYFLGFLIILCPQRHLVNYRIVFLPRQELGGTHGAD